MLIFGMVGRCEFILLLETLSVTFTKRVPLLKTLALNLMKMMNLHVSGRVLRACLLLFQTHFIFCNNPEKTVASFTGEKTE